MLKSLALEFKANASELHTYGVLVPEYSSSTRMRKASNMNGGKERKQLLG